MNIFKKLINYYKRKQINIIPYQYRLYCYTNILLSKVDRRRNLIELVKGDYDFKIPNFEKCLLKSERVIRYE